MKTSSADMKSSCTNHSKQEIFDDDTSSYESDSVDEGDEDYSLEDSYDYEVAHVHDHEIALAAQAKEESNKDRTG